VPHERKRRRRPPAESDRFLTQSVLRRVHQRQIQTVRELGNWVAFLLGLWPICLADKLCGILSGPVQSPRIEMFFEDIFILTKRTFDLFILKELNSLNKVTYLV
jgi:hypothetical protein